MSRLTLAAAIAATAAPAALAEPFDLAIDPAQSTIEVTLDISSLGQDTDSTPVAGFFRFDPEPAADPGEISLLDYEVRQQETIELDVGNFFGGIEVTGTDIELAMPPQAPPVGPEPVSESDEFSFMDVPANTEGILDYEASGLVCDSLESNDLPCSGTIDLAVSVAQTTIPEVSGTYTVEGETATVESEFTLTEPIDPDNPDFGTLTVNGTIVATGELPSDCPADLTGPGGEPDGQVTSADFLEYINLFAAGDPEADLTGPGGEPDGMVTSADFLEYIDLFAAGCP